MSGGEFGENLNECKANQATRLYTSVYNNIPLFVVDASQISVYDGVRRRQGQSSQIGGCGPEKKRK
uniref:Uncharacterized protein n=1 Tax=Romanomermis culicivorax TaxID=13658 RepID=A0A915KN51_ROMCU